MPRKSSAVAVTDVTGAIAERAYYKALNRGFAPGYELDDWLEAEREEMGLAKAVSKPRGKRGSASRAKN